MKRLVVLPLLMLAGCADAQPVDPEATSPGPTPAVAISTVAPTPQASRTPAAERMPAPPRTAQRAKVLRVTDGDTIVLDTISVGEIDRRTGGRKSRLIGVDTPEVFGRAECFGRQASAFTEGVLGGRDVLVDFDVDPIDRYGRALVYVWETDGTFFNGRLVAEGYASQSTFVPNVRYAELFTRLARVARESDRGLWSACD